MVRKSWKIIVGLILAGMTILLGLIHIAVFKNSKDLFFYLTLDIVFVPIQVLLVTVIIERLLVEREKQLLMKKMNMVIGAFFGEVGNLLLKKFLCFCPDSSGLGDHLWIKPEWKDKDYKIALSYAESGEFKFAPDPSQLQSLRKLLLEKRGFLLMLLENPNLLEHENFTDLLWAVFHLAEELDARGDLASLPESDLEHLRNDLRRAFLLLLREWLAYLRHLRDSYPYIYSLALRTNPFNPQSSPIVKG